MDTLRSYRELFKQRQFKVIKCFIAIKLLGRQFYSTVQFSIHSITLGHTRSSVCFYGVPSEQSLHTFVRLLENVIKLREESSTRREYILCSTHLTHSWWLWACYNFESRNTLPLIFYIFPIILHSVMSLKYICSWNFL